jgi:hypothetical protein
MPSQDRTAGAIIANQAATTQSSSQDWTAEPSLPITLQPPRALYYKTGLRSRHRQSSYNHQSSSQDWTVEPSLPITLQPPRALYCKTGLRSRYRQSSCNQQSSSQDWTAGPSSPINMQPPRAHCKTGLQETSSPNCGARHCQSSCNHAELVTTCKYQQASFKPQVALRTETASSMQCMTCDGIT